MRKFIGIVLALCILACALPAAFAADRVFTLGTGGDINVTIAVARGTDIFANSPRLALQNASSENLTNISAEIQTSLDAAVFPLNVTNISYPCAVSADSVNAGDTVYFTIPQFTCRSDAPAGLYNIPLVIYYTDSAGASSTLFNIPISVYDDGVSAGGSAITGSVPKISVSGSTSPSVVVAGETVTLSVTFKNTSASTPINNLKVHLSSTGTFTPVSGSSSVVFDTIASGASKTWSIALKVSADSAPDSYAVNFTMDYDYPGAAQGVTDTDSISVPVIQIPKMQVSKLQAAPEIVYVGGELNIMTSVNNIGRSTLYNVTAKLHDKNGVFEDGESFLGNIASGSTGSVDIYVPSLGMGDADLELTITYEDEEGKSYTYTEGYQTFVEEKGQIVPDDPFVVDPPVQRSSSWVWILIAVLIVGGIVLLIVLKKRKAAKRAEAERLEAEAFDKDYLDKD